MRLSTRLNHHLDQPSTATDMRQFAVVTKKVYGGNRSAHGATTQQALAAIVCTAQQRDLNFHASSPCCVLAHRLSPWHYRAALGRLNPLINGN